MGAAVAVAALAVTAVSAKKQREEQKKAAKQERKAAEVQRAEQQAQQMQSRRQTIRESMLKQHIVMQQAQNTGVSGSSGEFGNIGGLATQAGSNIAGLNRQTLSADAQSRYYQSAADHQMRAGDWQGIGSLSGSIFGATSGDLMAKMPKGLFGSGGQTTKTGLDWFGNQNRK